ncbi:hypothetical protein DIPPA_21745 [Diplonema papillatum]|nr:hypothetical protein DIPPA_21745 [Diplonema papillatum]|eukprot:gene21722-33424_t
MDDGPSARVKVRYHGEAAQAAGSRRVLVLVPGTVGGAVLRGLVLRYCEGVTCRVWAEVDGPNAAAACEVEPGDTYCVPDDTVLHAVPLGRRLTDFKYFCKTSGGPPPPHSGACSPGGAEPVGSQRPRNDSTCREWESSEHFEKRKICPAASYVEPVGSQRVRDDSSRRGWEGSEQVEKRKKICPAAGPPGGAEPVGNQSLRDDSSRRGWEGSEHFEKRKICPAAGSPDDVERIVGGQRVCNEHETCSAASSPDDVELAVRPSCGPQGSEPFNAPETGRQLPGIKRFETSHCHDESTVRCPPTTPPSGDDGNRSGTLDSPCGATSSTPSGEKRLPSQPPEPVVPQLLACHSPFPNCAASGVFASTQPSAEALSSFEASAERKRAERAVDVAARKALNCDAPGSSRLRRNQGSLLRTKQCRNWDTDGACRYHKRCKFAHC